MVSRENKIIAACVLLTIPLYFGVAAVEALPDWSGYAVLFVFGVLLPTVLTNR
ncbi:hypothetical protein [Halorussus marinus]|uniref:hypothetical protein n=1 Tax=Halorussus marinus TaxID=2505976 RepID=UPI001430D2B1|nr:hypothetical protein [Halorussus marinus]